MNEADPVAAQLIKWTEIFMRRSMHSFGRFAKENNISMSQMNTLFHLYHKGDHAVSEVGEHMGITSAAASQILERMVQQGLVERTEDPSDRRVKRIAITEKGRALLDEGIRIRSSWINDLEHSLTDDEKEKIITGLKILIAKTSSQLESFPDDKE